MKRAYLGMGCGFPVKPNGLGDLQTAEYEESVQQSIWIILSTAKGERVMRPQFGCGIHDLLFAVGGPRTESRIAHEIHEALLEWEPRIDVLQVSATTESNGEVLSLTIEYEVRATNNVFNLVFPFYLLTGDAA